MTHTDRPDDLPAVPPQDDAGEEARLLALLASAREHYNVPPRAPDLDAMWSRIDRDAFASAAAPRLAVDVLPLRHARARWTPSLGRYGTWAGLAAGLMIGVAVGRGFKLPTATPSATVAEAPTSSIEQQQTQPVDQATARYLGQTAALLVSLPVEPRRTSDPAFVDRARQLLSTTRLLLDAPAAADPATRALLEDLELVLAQIVGIEAGNRRAELELINQALEQRELLGRLHDAVNSAPTPTAGADD